VTILYRVSKKEAQTRNLIKIRPFEAVVFHADADTDGRTVEHDEADSRFS
jgi:hypothetical protein